MVCVWKLKGDWDWAAPAEAGEPSRSAGSGASSAVPITARGWRRALLPGWRKAGGSSRGRGGTGARGQRHDVVSMAAVVCRAAERRRRRRSGKADRRPARRHARSLDDRRRRMQLDGTAAFVRSKASIQFGVTLRPDVSRACARRRNKARATKRPESLRGRFRLSGADNNHFSPGFYFLKQPLTVHLISRQAASDPVPVTPPR